MSEPVEDPEFEALWDGYRNLRRADPLFQALVPDWEGAITARELTAKRPYFERYGKRLTMRVYQDEITVTWKLPKNG